MLEETCIFVEEGSVGENIGLHGTRSRPGITGHGMNSPVTDYRMRLAERLYTIILIKFAHRLFVLLKSHVDCARSVDPSAR